METEYMFDVICAGQAVIDCITRGREKEPYRPNTYRAETVRLHTGGDAVNESMALAGMGYRTAVVCGIGRDLAGDFLADRLEKAGVDTGRISRMDYDTPIANLMVAEDGSRSSVNSGAIRLPGYRVSPDSLAGAKIVSFASLFRAPFADTKAAADLIRTVKERHVLVCCDTKLPLSDEVRIEDFKEALPLIDYFFPNEKEAAFLSGMDKVPDMAAALRSKGLRNVIIKTGPEGCYVNGEEGVFTLPAEPVGRVVDSTGAGDNFAAGFISGLLQEKNLRECAAMGIHQAAQAITHIGG